MVCHTICIASNRLVYTKTPNGSFLISRLACQTHRSARLILEGFQPPAFLHSEDCKPLGMSDIAAFVLFRTASRRLCLTYPACPIHAFAFRGVFGSNFPSGKTENFEALWGFIRSGESVGSTAPCEPSKFPLQAFRIRCDI